MDDLLIAPDPGPGEKGLCPPNPGGGPGFPGWSCNNGEAGVGPPANSPRGDG